MPLVVTAELLMAVVPLTASVLRPVTVSAALLPSTALPVMVKDLALPATVPCVVMVLPVSVVSVPRVTASP